ncbi:carbon storage regulator [Marinobacter sp. CA1]|uniref:carbon storage regulator n=1 Tax=Marinobacter sp. CA1 TaxID=2817656 RepID=UPI001D07B6E8|nr:carbon storage regulator [Marinobacter sp. CA1]UDL04012.1 carbon storage regulator [Marinobacter sp. CA1]
MLILTRRVGETLVITPPGCEPIEVTILAITGYQARIATKAPADVVIDRLEIHERKKANAE